MTAAKRIQAGLEASLRIAGLLLVPAFASAGPLEDYLAKPASSVKWDAPGPPPQISVRKYQRMFRQAEKDWDKGVAIGNLSTLALRMAQIPEARAAGRELLDTWVMPNLDATKVFNNTYSVGWRHSLLRAKQTYKLCGDLKAEKECLSMLFEANKKEGDKDLAVYLLAYQQAGQGDYQAAIKTINYLKEDSKYARNREKLIRIWTKDMKRKQSEESTQDQP